MEARNRIACAIDVSAADRAVELVTKLREHVGVFKVGLELLSAEGPGVLDRLRDAGARKIFYDAKLFDIPNTVAGAMRGIAARAPWCVTVHACGGAAILKAAVESARTEAERLGVERTRVIAVTVLTSIPTKTLQGELGVPFSLEAYVIRLACMAREASCDGVVTSPRETSAVRVAIPDPDFLIITPGVRPSWSEAGDQARVTTPADAVKAGASLMVIGRPITAAPDPVEAAERIAQEIASA